MPKVAALKPKPAMAPLSAPSATVGADPRNQPRVTAAIRPKTAAPPKTLAGCPGFMSAVIPAACFQALPKMALYQGPPMPNTSTTEIATAIQFMSAPGRAGRMGGSGCAVHRIDPQHGLGLLDGFDFQIDGDGFIVAAHQHAFQGLVGAGVDFLMRHI